MAEIAVHFSTVEKTMVAHINGVPVENVEEIRLSRGDGGDFGCSLLTSERDEESDLRTFKQLLARDSREGKDAAIQGTASDSRAYNEFVEVTVDQKLQAEIARFFGV